MIARSEGFDAAVLDHQQFVGDVFRESTSPDSAYGVITTIVLAAVFAAAAVSLMAADATFSAFFFVIVAASLLGKIVKALIKAYLPRLYQKIIDTF